MVERAIRVFIPPTLRTVTGGKAEVEVPVPAARESWDAAMAPAEPGRYTVREVIDWLDGQYPGLRAALCQGERLKPGLSVSTEDRICSLGLREPLGAATELHFLPSLGGG